jgi:large subunit ribosomal protein L9
MKVILTEEVKGKGSEGDVVDVARGFAVNYLFPRRLAVEATSGNLKQLESRRTNIDRRELKRVADAQAIADALEGKSVSIEAKAGEEGRLFGSVTAQMVQEAVLAEHDIEIDKKRLDVPGGHLKTIGEHVATLSLGHDIKVEIGVTVTPEGGEFIHDAETEALAAARREAAEVAEAISAMDAGEEQASEAAEYDESSTDDVAMGLLAADEPGDAADTEETGETDDAEEADQAL